MKNALMGRFCGRSCLNKVISWARPTFPVQVVDAAGQWRVFDGSSKQKPISRYSSHISPYGAVLVSPDQVLDLVVKLPNSLTDGEMQAALALHVQSCSPFSLEDTVWTSSPHSRHANLVHYKVILASRKVIHTALQGSAVHFPEKFKPEVWFLDVNQRQFVFPGWGEQLRLQRGVWWAYAFMGILLASCLALTALMMAPTAQLRLRAIDAFHQFQELSRNASPQLKKKEQLVKLVEKETAVRKTLESSPNALKLLALLTESIGDDTFIQNIEIQGLHVKLSGTSTNSATLMSALGTISGIKELQAPTPASRLAGSNQEIFMVEFNLEPNTLSMADNGPNGATTPLAISVKP